MKFLKSPIGTFSTVSLILFLLVLSPLNIAFIAKYVLISIFALFLAIFVHELGHIVGGKVTGSPLVQLTVGPFSIQRNKYDKLSFCFNSQWAYIGGLAMVQIDGRSPNFRKKVIIHTLGGPLASFIFSIFLINDAIFLHLFGLFNLILFVTTIIPYHSSGLFSDGFVIWKMFKNDQSFIRYYRMAKMLTSSQTPNTWDFSLIKESAAINPNELSVNELNIYLMFLFYGTVVSGDQSNLRKFIRNIDMDRLDGIHKIHKASIMYFYVASQFILGETITFSKNDFKQLASIDVLSKLRTMSIFESAEGEIAENTAAYIHCVRQGSTESYGFWKVEQLFLDQYLIKNG